MLHPQWNVRLLGGLALDDGGVSEITHFPTRKTALLFAYLALNAGKEFSREALADLLWPDVPVDTARHSLRQAVSALRRLLEPPGRPRGSVLLARGNQYLRLNPDTVSVDAIQFEKRLQRLPAGETEALQEAIALYAGELLPDFYDDWVLAERQRLAERHRDALITLRGRQEAEVAPSYVVTPPVTPREGRTRLPSPVTRFFGREGEKTQLCSLLVGTEPARLVTLTGTGGNGKTRLAIETGHTVAESFPGGVLFVSFLDGTNGALLLTRIRAALVTMGRLPPRSSGDILSEIAAGLAEKRTLLILDNFEQVSEAENPFIGLLLERTPLLSCLVTSRRSLGLLGEREFPVPPLPIPPSEGSTDELIRLPSVQLFLDRARSVRPDFQITPQNAAAMASLLRTLEGIPLAIELAAARVRVLSPAELLAHLQDRFQFLQSRDPNALVRHRTLFAAVDGSVRLLPPPVRQFFLYLSVFRGGWTLATASVVVDTDRVTVLDHMERLRQVSLILSDDNGPTLRFRLLDTLREYAASELSPEETTSAQRRYADYFIELAERAGNDLSRPGQPQADALQTLDTERENLYAAYAIVERDGLLAARLRLVSALAFYWVLRGEFRTGRVFLESTYVATASLTEENLPDSSRLRSRLADALGTICAQSGSFTEAKRFAEESLTISRRLKDAAGIARSLNNLGSMAVDQLQWEKATPLLQEAFEYAQRTNRPPMIAAIQNNLALALMETGQIQDAEAIYQNNLTLRREIGDWRGVAITLLNLANIRIRDKNGQVACDLYRESLRLYQEVGELPQMAIALEGLGEALLLTNAFRNAAFVFGVAEALRKQIGATCRPEFDARYPAMEAQLCETLGNDLFHHLFAEGEAEPRDKALSTILNVMDG